MKVGVEVRGRDAGLPGVRCRVSGVRPTSGVAAASGHDGVRNAGAGGRPRSVLIPKYPKLGYLGGVGYGILVLWPPCLGLATLACVLRERLCVGGGTRTLGFFVAGAVCGLRCAY